MLLVVLVILSAFCLTTAQELSGNGSSQLPFVSEFAAQQLQGVSGSETCLLPQAQSAIEETSRQLLKEES